MKVGVVAFSIVILAGCGSKAAAHSARSVASAFQAEHIRLSRVRTNPEVVLASPKGSDGASAVAVFVFPDVGSAENAQQKQTASLRSSSQEWLLLTGRNVDLSHEVTRADNVVVLFSSGVSATLRDKVSSALRRLGDAS